MKPEVIESATLHLHQNDPILSSVIRRVGAFTLQLRPDHFQALVRAILAQQISGSAAASIRARLEALVAPEEILPENLAALTPEQLRSAGVSGQKAKYLLSLATKVRDGELDLKTIAGLEDEQVIAQLIQVKGIGVWTAQMFLIFSLGRPDVFPHDDLGIRSAIKRLYNLKDLPDKKTSHRIAERWRPFASIASWYCWRSLDIPNELVDGVPVKSAAKGAAKKAASTRKAAKKTAKKKAARKTAAKKPNPKKASAKKSVLKKRSAKRK